MDARLPAICSSRAICRSCRPQSRSSRAFVFSCCTSMAACTCSGPAPGLHNDRRSYAQTMSMIQRAFSNLSPRGRCTREVSRKKYCTVLRSSRTHVWMQTPQHDAARAASCPASRCRHTWALTVQARDRQPALGRRPEAWPRAGETIGRAVRWQGWNGSRSLVQ